MYQIKVTSSAREDLLWFRKYDQQQIISAIEAQLGRYRIFYDIDLDARVVAIIAVGYKQGNILYIRGKEYQL